MLKAVVAMALVLTAPAKAAGWPDLSNPGATQGGGEKDAAVIVGVERYPYVTEVPGAVANANDWYAWLTKSRKVPIGKVRLLRNGEAVLETLRDEAEWAAGAVKPGGTLWFVFIGHGAPAKDGKDGLLVGADAQQTARSLYARSLPQRELLASLGKGKQARTITVFDSCFSGKSTGGEALVDGLQPLIPVEQRGVDAKTVVLTAGRSDQFAGPLPGAKRPAFSYLVLGALRGWGDANGDGKVTADEVSSYANDALVALVKDRRQTPELVGTGSAALASAAKEKGPDLGEMVMAFGGTTSVVPGVVTPSGPRIKSGSVTAAVGELTVSTKPRDGVRLEVTGPDGRTQVSASPYRNSSASPGRWKVVAQLQGHATEEQFVEVLPDEPALVKLELKPFGGLLVTGTPTGASVKVTGPGGFANSGGLPWEAEGLASGGYRVEVSRKGYEDILRTATVAPGATTRLEVKLEKQGQAAGLGNGTCPAGMARVSGGAFERMFGGEQLSVTVQPFCLDVTEVTVAAYAKCAQCTAAGTGESCNAGASGRAKHPINCVDWHQAEAYCREGGKRLPTEDEWEWAARGGANGWDYPWGNTAPTAQLCWNGEGNDQGKGNRRSTCAVGSFPRGASPEGIQDLAGNVWEWTSTAVNSDRLNRGGSWFLAAASFMRAGIRNRAWDAPSHQRSDLGFRCAMAP